MAETEIRLKIEIDSATGEVKIKNFGKAVNNVVEKSTQKINQMKTAFQRVAEFGEKVFFTIEGYKRLLAPLGDLINAANDFEQSNMKLAATAKLTGADLDQLNITANKAKEAYKLNTIQANEMTIALTKLGQKAGDVSQTSAAMGRLLDLAAAQGLDAEQALTAINQAILGIDEGTDKLFQKNPSAIYAEYARQIGTTAGKLTDQQKAQALLNAVMEYGGKVQGAYGDFLESNAGKQAATAANIEELRAKFGRLINKAYVPLLEIGNKALTFFNNLNDGVLQFITVAAGLSVIGFKLIPMFNAWNTSFKILGVSIKSAMGWLGLIITAATLLYTAWATNLGGFQEKLKVAFEYLKWFVNYGKELIKGYIDFVKNYFGGIGKILSSAFKLDVEGIKQGLKQVADAALNSGQQTAERLKAITRERDRNITSIHAQYVQKQSEIDQKSIPAFKTTEQQKTKITEDEIKKRLQKEQELQDYKFQTGRLSLQEYQNILDQRIEAARQTYGEESIEYLKLIDQKKKLNEEAKQHALEQEKELQELRLATIQDAHQRELKELAIWYQEQLQKFAENEEAKALIEEQYRQQKREIEAAEEERRFEAEEARREWEWQAQEIDYQAYAAFLDRKVAYAKKKYGEQSLEYKKALLERANLDKQAALSATNIFSKLMDAFQGTNRTLFNIGKAAAIARAIINTYEAVTKAYTAYPYPWNLAAAAAQLALGYAQVRKITSVSFNESAGAKDQQFTAAQNKLKGIKPKIKGHAKGGKVEEPTLGLVGEAGPEIIAPEKDFIAVFKEMFAKGLFNIDFSAFFNRLLTQFENALNRMVEGFKIAFAPPAVEPMQFAGALAGGSVTNINQTTVQTDNSSIIELLNEIKELIENKELRAEIDAEELAIVVENGQEQLKRGEI
ncbi:hypothetical protein Calab_0715 [Caldithrix abyssi DSM 13497]|uniref:Phage tail length tape-measure protein n=1 Tax=Caldithrix abyssi DSM 13497 TaxID=880073 RepID=H1XTC1_CALAY|nr:hypothetical protein [Caldithrix abyssi]APF20309.1 Phage tail length tape-measure protein [Caldithrix abyssi DSM 13497]EHO40354.1 hypothetical protein Calab_0715 [Caldithrix abyssi DSM 13497]